MTGNPTKKIISPARKCQEQNTEEGRQVGEGKEGGRCQPQSGGVTTGKGDGGTWYPAALGARDDGAAHHRKMSISNPEHPQA